MGWLQAGQSSGWLGAVGARQAGDRADLLPWADQNQWLTGDRCTDQASGSCWKRGGVRYRIRLRRFVLKRNWRRRSQTTVADGGHRARGGCGDGLRPVGHDCGPSDGTPAGGVGADHRAGLLAASFVWPTHGQTLEDIIAGLEAAWVCFGGVEALSGHRQLPASGGGTRPAAYALHQRLYWNTAPAASPMRRGCGNLRTSPRWSVACPKYDRSAWAAFHGLPHLRSEAQRWCLEVAGMRIHGSSATPPGVSL